MHSRQLLAERQQKQRDAIERAKREDAKVAQMVETPSGQEGLKILESQFCGISHNLGNPNPYDTAFREGQRSVVEYIKRCKEAANVEEY